MTLRALKVRGSFHGPTGHDRHVRAFTRELVRAGVQVQLVDMPEWSARRLPAPLLDPWFDTLSTPVDASLYLQFCMPHQVRRERDMANVNFTMFEADRVPDFWIKAAGKSLLTIVPEASSFAAWIRSGFDPSHLRTCPLGIDPEQFGARVEPMDLFLPDGEAIASRKIRFLNLSEVVPRKNQRGLLKTWLLATSRSDDAVLVMKIGGMERRDLETVRAHLPALEAETGKCFDAAAPVLFIADVFSDAEMPRLYATATHYVSLSFGEGWDLPLMEAAACGLQLIAPDHTAYRTYLDPAIATLIPTHERPAEATGDFRLFFDRSNWWEPDQDAAVEAFRRAIDDREQTIASARDYVLGHYTWRYATERLIAILSEAEQTLAIRG